MRMFPKFGDSSHNDPFDGREQHQGLAGLIVTWLFIASLTMLFAASLVGYLIVRFNSPVAPPKGTLVVPDIFLYSTLVLIIASTIIHIMSSKAQKLYTDPPDTDQPKRLYDEVEQPNPETLLKRHVKQFRTYVFAAITIGALFVMIQVPGLIALADQITENLLAPHRLAGLAAVLIGIHALHVVGGFVPLIMMFMQTYIAPQQRLHHTARYTAIYWHFLDAVWLVMLITLYLSA